ncbi:DNA/RNA helicase domain-containing protein [Halobacteriovorax sp. XZX-3]|uniref:DNA/RNA helicase domain-containing protein n=1 Tax=unclassified Halobacteriovorax TaxID=2639665 RepID=UPI00371E068C
MEKLSFKIVTDKFPKLSKNIKEYDNHCVTYLLHNNNELYVGESSNFAQRIVSHRNDKHKKQYNLTSTRVIISDYFNKSAVYDIETRLMNYMFSDGKYKIVNRKTNQAPHNYYMRDQINSDLFVELWKELKDLKIVKSDIRLIENSDLFKFSPFKGFSGSQLDVLDKIIDFITEETSKIVVHHDGDIIQRTLTKNENFIIVSGNPGTGKSLLISKIIFELYLVYQIPRNLKIGICLSKKNLIPTYRKVIRHYSKLNSSKNKIEIDLLKPSDLYKLNDKHYDLLLVDEAHRLCQYYSKQANFLKILENKGKTQLDFAREKSKKTIIFHDKLQMIRPADIRVSELKSPCLSLELKEQFRVKAGSIYTDWIKGLLQMDEQKPLKMEGISEYFKSFNTINDLYKEIKKKQKGHGVARIVAGFYIPWMSKPKNKKHIKDFKDEGLNVAWNSTDKDWVNSKNADNEIGCVHTVQGFDITHCGVIIGDDIYFDKKDNKVKIRKEHYYDEKGIPVKGTDPDDKELTQYIKNAYYVLLTRGIESTSVYIKDRALRERFNQYIKS